VISKETAELLSPALGAVGGVLLAIPFFFDFYNRVTRTKDNKLGADPNVRGASAGQVAAEINKSGTERVLGAEPWTAFVSGVGCIFLIASFVVLLLPRG
jgi:hypothetical protein